MAQNYILMICMVFFSISSFGQSISSYEFLDKGLVANDIAKRLPHLDTLISWARKNNPYLKSFNSAKEIGENKVKLKKRAWLNYITIDAGYGYGIFDNLSNQQIAGDPGNQVLFSSQQNRFNVGGSIKIPLSAIINRRREVINTKLEAETFRFDQQLAENELKIKVTEQYNEVLKFHKLVFISNAVVDTYRAQVVRAETEFADGVLNVAEYTRLLQMINQARMVLEVQKADFFKAFMTLENTVGVDLKI